jgi:hypothetical protein
MTCRRRLLASYPDRFIPVGNGGLTESPDEFLDAQEVAAQEKKMFLFGKFKTIRDGPRFHFY